MALNVDLRVLTQPGATGNQTISLASNFDPKAIILWSSGVAADVGTKAHAQFGIGFGTYRGSVVQQRFAAIDARDAATTGNTCSELTNDALLVLHTAANPGTRDLEIDLVSMQSGATSQVVINWVNLHGTASIRVNCLILGGSEITDALAGDFTRTASVASEDVTVAAGFGQPDLLFMLAGYHAVGDGVGASGHLSFGFGKKGQAGRSLTYGTFDGNTNMFVGMSQRSDVINRVLDMALTTTPLLVSYSLDTNPAANWPTDGFQINYDDQEASATEETCFLALKGTFTVTTGNGTAPTSGTPPVTQNLAHGSVPKLAFLFGWNLVAATTVDTASADLGAFFVGAGDGTVEQVCGLTDDDALGTSDCNSFQANTKVVRNYNQAIALQSEADGSISGNNFVLSWNDIDTVAREYQWLTLGDAVGGITATDLSATGSGTLSGTSGAIAGTPLNAVGVAASLLSSVAIWNVLAEATGLGILSGEGGALALAEGGMVGVGTATWAGEDIGSGGGSPRWWTRGRRRGM